MKIDNKEIHLQSMIDQKFVPPNKDQIHHMVQVLLKLPAAPQEDAADALAAAICHAHAREGLHSMSEPLAAARLRRGRLSAKVNS